MLFAVLLEHESDAGLSIVRAGAGLQIKTCELILGHVGEGIGGRNFGFDSAVQIESRLQIDVEGPETSKNLMQSFIHNIIRRRP